MLEKTRITETVLSDRNRMNDYNLDQTVRSELKILTTKLNESNLRLELQIKELSVQLEVLQERRDKQARILEGMQELKI